MQHYNESFQQTYSKLGYMGDYYHNYVIPLMEQNNIELVEAADYVDRKINIENDIKKNNIKKNQEICKLKLLFNIKFDN